MTDELVPDISRDTEIEEILTSAKFDLKNQQYEKKELIGLILSMPDVIRRQFGCMYCEWKGIESLCMLDSKNNKIIDKNDHMPKWICPRRASYLAGFVKDVYPDSYSGFVNTTMWRKAILTTTMHQQQMKDMFKFQQLQAQEELLVSDIEGLKLDPDKNEELILDKEKELKKLSSKIETARENWMKITDGLLFYNAKDMDREQPKKIDINHTTNIQDMNDFLNKSTKELNNMKVVDGQIIREDKKQ